MKAIQLTGEQLRKLDVLAQEVAPYFECRVRQSASMPPRYYIYDALEDEWYPWLEFCFTILSSMIAKKYIEHHMDCTESWAKRMILQKLAHEIETHNPIDTLYEIMTNPGAYAQGM
jgi:hypothetical protein